MFPIIFLVIFLVSWVLLLVRSFIITHNRSRLRSMASDILPGAARTIDSVILMPFRSFRMLFISFLQMLITFGHRHSVKKYIDNFYDIRAIEASGHPGLNHLLQRSIQHHSRYFRTWIIMVIALIAAAVTWGR